MRTYHPDILPINIAIIREEEIGSNPDLKSFTDTEGNPLRASKGALGWVLKALRHTESYTVNYSVICFCERPTVNTITHEAFHAACDWLGQLGIDFDNNCANEIYAYVIGYISGCINDAISKDKIWND